jgi:hypothetical protein
MVDFHDRRNGSIVKLEPLDNPALEATYHASESDALEAADAQGRNFGGFTYNLHKDGKPIKLSAVSYPPARTNRAAAYNKNKGK